MRELANILSEVRISILKSGSDGGLGNVCFLGSNKPMLVHWSNGGGWDHVSVSYPSRTPTWEEMCFVKNLFFLPEEIAVEYHPAKSEYKNLHPHCLHIWRYQAMAIPTPPILFV